MSNSSLPRKTLIDISTSTLLKALLIVVGVAFLFFIRDIVIILFVALILSSAFDPMVDWMQKYHIPRSLGVSLVYLGLLILFVGAVYLIIPPIVVEVNQLVVDFPARWASVADKLGDLKEYSNNHQWLQEIYGYLKGLQEGVGVAAGGFFSTVSRVFGGIVSFIVIAVIVFYMTVEEQATKRLVRSLVPLKHQPYLTNLMNRMQDKIGLWLRGQLILSLVIFVLVWIGLTILGVKYAVVLALLAGVMEIVPYLGPIISAIPAVFIAFTQYPMLAVGVLILYYLIQFAENHILVPQVMRRTVGLNPVITIVALLVGAKIAGILGIALAVPVTTAIGVAVGDFLDINKKAVEEDEDIESA